MMHGSTSPAEFDEMDPFETELLAERVYRERRAEIELRVTLAKFIAGAAAPARQASEVR